MPDDKINTASDALLYGLTGRSRQGLEDRAAAGYGAMDVAKGDRPDRAMHSVASELMTRRFGPTVARTAGDMREFGQGVGSFLTGAGFYGAHGFDAGDQQANDAGIAAGLRPPRNVLTPPSPPGAPTGTVTTAESNFHLPEFLAPPAAKPVPLAPLVAPQPQSPASGNVFDDALNEFLSGRTGNASGSAFPTGETLALPPVGGAAATEPSGMVLPNELVDFNPTDNTGLAGAGPNAEERGYGAGNSFDMADLFRGVYGGL